MTVIWVLVDTLAGAVVVVVTVRVLDSVTGVVTSSVTVLNVTAVRVVV